MPRNGSGLYTLAESPFVAGTVILSADVNSDFDDIADALTASIAADGQTPITGPLLGTPGTAALPAWSFAVDPDTGWYRISSNVAGVTAGGTLVQSWAAGASSITGTLATTDAITVTNAAADFVAFEAIGTSAGAGTGAVIKTYHNSATPANNDIIGAFDLAANDSGGNKTTFTRLAVIATDVTNGSEDADIYLQAILAGVQTTRIQTTAVGGNLTGDWTASGAVTATSALSGATAAGPMLASAAEQETATATNKLVVPGLQQRHPSAAKAWVNFNGSNGAINASYNVTSVTKNATGDYTVNFTTAFSSVNYCSQATCGSIGGSAAAGVSLNRSAAGTSVPASATAQRLFTFNVSGFAAADPDQVYWAAFGDQ